MPHVVLQGPINLSRFIDEFKPSVHKVPEVIRFTEILISRPRQRALLETIVVESGYSRRFYIDVHQKEEEIVIRLDPLTDPEKTDGVKRSLALVAKTLMSQSDQSKVSRTNLEAFLT
jgi:hypothetical protein